MAPPRPELTDEYLALIEAAIRKEVEEERLDDDGKMQVVLKQISSVLDKEAPEIRLDALERLMQLYGNQIDGKCLANTQNDIQEFHIPAKSPVKIKEEAYTVKIEQLEEEQTPELKYLGNSRVLTAVGDRDFPSQEQLEKRIINANIGDFNFLVYDGQLTQKDMDERGKQLGILFKSLSRGGYNRITHRNVQDHQKNANCVFNYYNYFILLLSLTDSASFLWGKKFSYVHIYRRYLEHESQSSLQTCTAIAATFAKLIHSRGLLVPVTPEIFKPYKIIARIDVKQAIQGFISNEDVKYMSKSIRRGGKFKALYSIIDSNASAI